jgi:hypothetical protein
MPTVLVGATLMLSLYAAEAMGANSEVPLLAHDVVR